VCDHIRQRLAGCTDRVEFDAVQTCRPILGGMGNTPGVMLAAILLTLLPEGLRALAGVEHLPGLAAEFPLSWVGNLRMIIYSLLLIVLMLTRPQGLFKIRIQK